MISYLSKKIAGFIVRHDDEADFEVIAYGYDLILQEIGVVLASLLCALPFGLFIPVAMSITAYNLVRRFAGGAHAKYRPVCVTMSVLIMFGPAVLFTKAGLPLPLPAMAFLYILGALFLFLYAPADTALKPITEHLARRRSKIGAIICHTLCFAIAFGLQPQYSAYAAVLACVSFTVCCLTHPWAYLALGCRKSNIFIMEES